MLAATPIPNSIFSSSQPISSVLAPPLRENLFEPHRQIRIDSNILTLRLPFFVPLYSLCPLCETYFKLDKKPNQ